MEKSSLPIWKLSQFAFLPILAIFCARKDNPAMNRIFEKSSGGIVYRKNGNTIDVLLLERKNAKSDREYVLPKG